MARKPKAAAPVAAAEPIVDPAPILAAEIPAVDPVPNVVAGSIAPITMEGMRVRTNLPEVIPEAVDAPVAEPAPRPAVVTGQISDFLTLLEAGHAISRVDWMNEDRQLSIGRRGGKVVVQVTAPDPEQLLKGMITEADLAADDWALVG